MSDGNKNIHDFDFNLICDYYSVLERQGPGSIEVTKKALSFITNLKEDSKIADIGCGTGGQTLILANTVPGSITGIDLFPKFIEILKRNAHQKSLHHRIKGIVGSMENLPFEEDEMDLIWSEGAIYNIGFKRGLNEWKKFLKKGGFIAVSEASWFTEERPDEIEKFWNDAYPEIDTIANKVEQMQNAGYVPAAAFILPENCWTENYYFPQISVQDNFLKKHAGNKTAEDLVENQRYEASLYAKYKDYYGYTFYIGKKL